MIEKKQAAQVAVMKKKLESVCWCGMGMAWQFQQSVIIKWGKK